MTSTWDTMMRRARDGKITRGEIMELVELLHDLDHDFGMVNRGQIISDAWEERLFQLTGYYLHDTSPEAVEKRERWFKMRGG